MQNHFKNPSRDGDRIPSPVKRRCRSGGGAARDASGTAPGRWSWWDKGRFAGSIAQWSVLLWQKREMWSVAKEGPCGSTFGRGSCSHKGGFSLFPDAYTVRSTGENGLSVR